MVKLKHFLQTVFLQYGFMCIELGKWENRKMGRSLYTGLLLRNN